MQLLDCTDRVKIQDVRNSKVFVGACSSQVIVSHCRDCTFTLAAREFYAHDTEVRDRTGRGRGRGRACQFSWSAG